MKSLMIEAPAEVPPDDRAAVVRAVQRLTQRGCPAKQLREPQLAAPAQEDAGGVVDQGHEVGVVRLRPGLAGFTDAHAGERRAG